MTSLAVGKFDALHLGHRALALQAARLGRPALLRLTGLAEAFAWTTRLPLIAEDDRARVLADWDADLRERCVDIRALRGLDGSGFLAWLKREHAATALVVGADFRCGRDRGWGITELTPLCRDHGVRLEVVAPVQVGGLIASSTRVRQALAQGDCAEAAACLGRPHRLHGTVRHGDGRGRGLGFPTANLAPANQPPAPGVYAAWAGVAGTRVPAAVNIGVLPTIAAERPLSVETHLLGWNGDCYGQALALDLIVRLRDERHFATLDALREQIAADVAAVAALTR